MSMEIQAPQSNWSTAPHTQREWKAGLPTLLRYYGYFNVYPLIFRFGYILVVVRKFVNSSTPPPPLNSYTIEDLVHLTSDTSLGRRRRQASGSTHPYISANLSSVDDLSSFVLGDGKMYGGYQNRELEEGVTYESTLYGENPTTGKVVAYPPNTFGE